MHDVHCDLSEDRHNVNASLIALAVYMEMNKGSISMEILENAALGFFVYDIGMTKVSPMLLAKGQFTPRERRTLCEHPKQGLEILARLNLTRPEITEPVIQHHERLNGIGYPNKLSGDQIGQLGRIAAVSDSYCAMVTARPRKKPCCRSMPQRNLCAANANTIRSSAEPLFVFFRLYRPIDRYPFNLLIF